MEDVFKGRSAKLHSAQSFVASAWSGISKNDIIFQVEESTLFSKLTYRKLKTDGKINIDFI